MIENFIAKNMKNYIDKCNDVKQCQFLIYSHTLEKKHEQTIINTVEFV